jgi:hypothetical protein
MTIHLDWKLFAQLTAGFIAATVVGTVSHEFGHFAMAKFLGHDATLHYGYTKYAYANAVCADRFLVTLAGPLESMLTGTIGLLLLWRYRKSFDGKNALSARQWLMVFTALFWLRQIANLLVGAISRRPQRAIGRDDESKIDHYLHLEPGMTLGITALFATVVTAIVIIKFVPKKTLPTFILAAVTGSALGYYLWLVKFGKIIMP